MQSPELDPDAPKRLSRGRVIRMVVALAVGIAAAGAFAFVRFWMPRSALGGSCRYVLNCAADAPLCMRATPDGEGACSRACDPAQDCAPGILCAEAELDERDERGMPIKGGYCFPTGFRGAKRARSRDAGGGDARSAPSGVRAPATARPHATAR